ACVVLTPLCSLQVRVFSNSWGCVGDVTDRRTDGSDSGFQHVTQCFGRREGRLLGQQCDSWLRGVTVEKLDTSGISRYVSGKNAKQGRFTGTVFADHPDTIIGGDSKRNIGKHTATRKRLRQADNAQMGKEST